MPNISIFLQNQCISTLSVFFFGILNSDGTNSPLIISLKSIYTGDIPFLKFSLPLIPITKFFTILGVRGRIYVS